MKGFLENFYNFDKLRGTLVSDEAFQTSWNLAVTASATAAVACISTWETDFRPDLSAIDLSTCRSSRSTATTTRFCPSPRPRSACPVKDLDTVVIEGGPHVIPWTHAEQVTSALLKSLP